MKISVDIDCTPAEARDFLGLPDVKPMQDWMMEEMQGRMAAGIGSMGMDEMLKIWMPAGIAGMEQLREFYTRMATLSTGAK